MNVKAEHPLKDYYNAQIIKGLPEYVARHALSRRIATLALGVMKTGKNLVYGTAKKYGVTIYEYANVGNHLHILMKIGRISRWAAFIRELTGRIALWVRRVLGLPIAEKFWRYRPHTRIVQSWKRAYREAKAYVHLNWLQAEGFINRKETKTLKDLRAIWQDG